jgi:DNA-binding NarL/FixJ family response regulator
MTSWSPPPLPSRLAASRQSPLVGRARELETLEALWTDVEHARRQVVFVGGEPGAGKTRLLAEAAGALHDNEVAVLVGACSPDAGIPYQPFADMLDHLFVTTAEGSLAELVGERGHELRRLSSAVVRHRPDVAEDRADVADVRRDLFDAVAGLIRAMAADRPVALVVDDLQWAQLPTLALLEHVVQECPDTRLLVLAAFRTNAPDRSDQLASRVAELHRLDGVRRLDLSGLDTDSIAEYVSLRSGITLTAARAPAALLRDRTGGNPFFLREVWADVERQGGVSSLRTNDRVPASIADTLAARLAGLTAEVRDMIELAAVLGETFDLATLVAASDGDRLEMMAVVDAAVAAGVIEIADPDGREYSFVHALVRQTVIERLPPSRRARLHARAAEALEQQSSDPALVPRLADHYLAADVLGVPGRAQMYCREAGRLADASLAFEDAALWFERAASLRDCDPATRAEMLLSAAAAYVKACHFPQARAIYERLTVSDDPTARLAAAMGFEDASWRPGVVGARAADLLSAAIAACDLGEHEARYVAALGSLGRALAFAGDTSRAREVGGRAIDLARALDDDDVTLSHVLITSLWHGTAPAVSDLQWERTGEAHALARRQHDYEMLGSAVNFRAMTAYLRGRPHELDEAVTASRMAAEATGQPYFRYVAYCLAHAVAFMRGDFAAAERWAELSLKENATVGDDMAEGPYGVQMFMVRRETGGLERFRAAVTGGEAFAGRWVPALLALYTELDIQPGMQRCLTHLMDRDLRARADEAQWPMELAFMTEAALALEDVDAARALRPLLADYGEMNLYSGTLIAVFGSTERLLGRVAALLGDPATAEQHFERALDMDHHMRSPVHLAETLAYSALFYAARGAENRAVELADRARHIAEPIGQRRVFRVLEALTRSAGPDGLSDRELDVLRLLASGLSNQEIGAQLHISANTAANHVRRILMKTGAANRTQAAMYAAQHQLV